MDGLFWGLWAGTHASIHQARHGDQLGYRPQAVRASVSLVQPGVIDPLWTGSVEPAEVVEAMDPLPRGFRDDDGRIREEEAKGFARVVVQKLSLDFQWVRHTEQRFYEDPRTSREGTPYGKPVEPKWAPPAMTPPPPPLVPPPPGTPVQPKQD